MNCHSLLEKTVVKKGKKGIPEKGKFAAQTQTPILRSASEQTHKRTQLDDPYLQQQQQQPRSPQKTKQETTEMESS